MIDISEGLAKTIHHWSNVVLVAAALAVGVATLISVWTEGILNRATDSRIAQNKRDSEQLKEKQRPRVILDEQKTAFLKALEGAPRGRVLLSYKFQDDEARLFALQIRDLLETAGYEPNQANNLAWFQGDEPRAGIGIRIASVETQPLYSGALQRALQAIGIEPILQSGAFNKDVPEIRVGSKP